MVGGLGWFCGGEKREGRWAEKKMRVSWGDRVANRGEQKTVPVVKIIFCKLRAYSGTKLW
jgi:hypothetical protein